MDLMVGLEWPKRVWAVYNNATNGQAASGGSWLE